LKKVEHSATFMAMATASSASDSTCTVDAVRHINGYVCMYVCMYVCITWQTIPNVNLIRTYTKADSQ